jgi:hypothetical protein
MDGSFLNGMSRFININQSGATVAISSAVNASPGPGQVAWWRRLLATDQVQMGETGLVPTGIVIHALLHRHCLPFLEVCATFLTASQKEPDFFDCVVTCNRVCRGQLEVCKPPRKLSKFALLTHQTIASVPEVFYP